NSVARVHQRDELNPFDHTTAINVKARDNSFRQHPYSSIRFLSVTPSCSQSSSAIAAPPPDFFRDETARRTPSLAQQPKHTPRRIQSRRSRPLRPQAHSKMNARSRRKLHLRHSPIADERYVVALDSSRLEEPATRLRSGAHDRATIQDLR